jgi:hypothetical protein
LITLSSRLPVRLVRLDRIRELDEPYWFGEEAPRPTCRALIDHMKLIEEADLSSPIVLSSKGGVMDGMHRVAKALLLGRKMIEAVQFEEDPEPDFVDVFPDDLSY